MVHFDVGKQPCHVLYLLMGPPPQKKKMKCLRSIFFLFDRFVCWLVCLVVFFYWSLVFRVYNVRVHKPRPPPQAPPPLSFLEPHRPPADATPHPTSPTPSRPHPFSSTGSEIKKKQNKTQNKTRTTPFFLSAVHITHNATAQQRERERERERLRHRPPCWPRPPKPRPPGPTCVSPACFANNKEKKKQ